MKQRIFLAIFVVMAVFAVVSCDSLWEHKTEKPVTISFDIPEELLYSVVEEKHASQIMKNVQGVHRALANIVSETDIIAKVSLHSADNDSIFAEQTLNLGDSFDDIITFERLDVVGETVYAQIELTQPSSSARIEKSKSITVVSGLNRIEFDFSYVVSFDVNGGMGAISPETWSINDRTIEHPLTSPTMQGKLFMGWSTTRDDESTRVIFPYEVLDEADKTLYAIWVDPSSYTTFPLGSYSVSRNQVTITGDETLIGDINVPPYIEGKLVTSISGTYTYGAFPRDVTSVVLPEGITTIDENAFRFSSITNIVLPNTVKIINREAFAGSDLASIHLPQSVTSLDPLAFNRAFNLDTISVEDSNTVYSSLDGNLYNKNKTTLIQYALGKTEFTFSIPNSVTTIEYGAFDGNTVLYTVTIPNSVTRIEGHGSGFGAFNYCTALTSLDLPDSIEYLGEFSIGQLSITEITIPPSVTYIGQGFLRFCNNLTSIRVEATNPPVLGSEFLYDVNLLPPIYVPPVSVDAYKTAENWDIFADNIVGY